MGRRRISDSDRAFRAEVARQFRTALQKRGMNQTQAARELSITVPLVVRMQGTNVELGRKILKDSGLPIISAETMAEGAEKIVQAVKTS